VRFLREVASLRLYPRELPGRGADLGPKIIRSFLQKRGKRTVDELKFVREVERMGIHAQSFPPDHSFGGNLRKGRSRESGGNQCFVEEDDQVVCMRCLELGAV